LELINAFFFSLTYIEGLSIVWVGFVATWVGNMDFELLWSKMSRFRRQTPVTMSFGGPKSRKEIYTIHSYRCKKKNSMTNNGLFRSSLSFILIIQNLSYNGYTKYNLTWIENHWNKSSGNLFSLTAHTKINKSTY